MWRESGLFPKVRSHSTDLFVVISLSPVDNLQESAVMSMQTIY